MNMTFKILNDTKNVPMILLLVGYEDRERLEDLLERYTDQAVFVMLYGFDWNRDLSPWKEKAVFGDEDFGGEADRFLAKITEDILPQIYMQIGYCPPWIGIAGYSLAGLFAIYSLFRTRAFDRAVLASGSLWYDGFTQYVSEHDFVKKPDKIYFSLGDKEHRTKNPRMRTVLACTEEIVAECRQRDVMTTFVREHGSHFDEPEERLVRGIGWILQ